MVQTSLRHRIVVLCTSLVLLTSVIIQAASWWSTSRFNNNQITASINNAQHVFEQYLLEKEKLLATAARVLTADFGFKQAVTTNDAETITSVLLNHGQRIDADLMLLTNLEGQLISSSLTDFDLKDDQQLSLRALLNDQGKTHFMMLNNTLYQVLVLPVKAPRAIAYAYVGFEIDVNVTGELKQLTGLDISFFNNHEVLVSSTTFPDARDLESHLMSASLPWFFWDRPAFDNRQLELSMHNSSAIKVFLTADLSPTYKEYDALISTITIIASLIMLAAILISGLFAKNLTRPLLQLVDVAKEYAKGQYGRVLSDKSISQEMSTLFDAVSDMGNEINTREQHILHQAQHDTLTDLYNRHTLRQIIEEELQPSENYLLIAINIRGFSNLNDALGIQIGDACLKALAKRLSNFDAKSKHARLNGDVFLSLIPVTDAESSKNTVEHFFELLAQPLQLKSIALNLKFWSGITSYPQDCSDDDPQAIFRRTMIALDASEKENQPLRYYQAGEEEARLERLKIVETLKEALTLDDGQLYMNYQPKLNLKTGKIDKVESLIRWQHPELGFVSPELFISYAEQTGIIFELTSWVVNTVLKQLADWQQQGVVIEAAINISAQDITHPDFHMNLMQASAKHGISPEHITLEVTERDLMQDEEQAVALLVDLKKSGYTISVDDYGIGQSSLAKLKQLPVDELKIDKSFIMELAESESDQIIVGSTITLGHRLGLSVVAEGLENDESLQLLKTMKCDHLQGYFIARPMTHDAFIDWLKDYEQKES